MDDQSKAPEDKQARDCFNIMGLVGFFLSPIIAFVVMFVMISLGEYEDADNNVTASSLIGLFMLLSSVCFIFSVIASIRREKNRAITFMGILLNVVPFSLLAIGFSVSLCKHLFSVFLM